MITVAAARRKDRPPTPALTLDNISKTYVDRNHETTVLREVSLTVSAGEVVWLRGPSGGGKSSVLRIAGLLSEPTIGTVLLGGDRASARKWPGPLRARAVGIVFQSGNLLNDLTIEENLEIAALPGRREQIPALLHHWGLTELAARKARLVSGGELQRAALCRGLVNDPTLLLADEPTAALDAANAERVLSAIQQTAEAGKAVLVASHDERVANVATRTLHIEGGHIV